MKTKTKFLYICIAFAIYSFFCPVNEKETNASSDSSHAEEHEVIEEHAVEAFVIENVPNWDNFIEAVIWKESRGDANAIGDNGRAVGVLQIHPIMVREANRILALKKDKTTYTYEDRFNREKSIEIFNIVQGYHNKNHDFDLALQIWNKNHPESYKTQIMGKYNELQAI